MTKRRYLLLSGLPAVTLAGLLACWLFWPRAAITVENAARIHEGMLLADVEAILGGPARYDRTGPVIREDPPEFAPPDTKGIRWRISIINLRPHLVWESDEARIWVHLDSEDRVTDCQWFPMRREEETPLAMIRRWLRG